jgi:hypothetical protein
LERIWKEEVVILEVPSWHLHRRTEGDQDLISTSHFDGCVFVISDIRYNKLMLLVAKLTQG